MVVFALVGAAAAGIGGVLVGAAVYDDYSHSDHSDYSDAAVKKRLENELRLKNEQEAAQTAYNKIRALQDTLDDEYGNIISIKNYDVSELNDKTIKTLNIKVHDAYNFRKNTEIQDKTKDLVKEIKALDTAIGKLQEVQERLQSEGL